MHVFVTGATGFVGSAVVEELIGAGHTVLGLARSDAGAATLTALGATVHRGSLENLGSMRSGACAADAVIHTAFNHDFSKFAANCELDQAAIEALGEALRGSDRPLLVTSGLGQRAPGHVATEQDPPIPPSISYPRASESTATALAARGINASLIRLPPSVHGDGDHGFVPGLINIARGKGAAAYIGEGLNRWSAVHRRDAARVYRLALENGGASGPNHAVAETGVPFKDIARVIARRRNIPLVALTHEEATRHFGWFTHFAEMDVPASSDHTRAILGWKPEQSGLIADLDRSTYFQS
jgi:nucleoside-diphosphate-sugar epimerase